MLKKNGGEAAKQNIARRSARSICNVAMSGMRPPIRQAESIARLRQLHARIPLCGKASRSPRDLRQGVARRSEKRARYRSPGKDENRISGADSLAAFVIRMKWVDGHVVLARRLENPHFGRIETFSPRNHLHAFRFESVGEIDDEVEAWFAEAYRVGEQRHLV
jgi:hypothetical protein